MIQSFAVVIMEICVLEDCNKMGKPLRLKGVVLWSKLEMVRFYLEGKCLFLNLLVDGVNSRWVDFS